MADDDLAMTWNEKVYHWGIALVVPLAVLWGAVAVTSGPAAAGRHGGAVLELLGFVVAAYGLQEKVAQVTDRLGLRGRVAGWLRRAWRRIKMAFGWKPPGQTIGAPAAQVTVEVPDVRVSTTAAPDPTLDERVDNLEREVDRIRKSIRDVEADLHRARAEIEAEIEDVRSDLRDVEDELEDLVRRLAIGSLHWEATGLLWFALGVVVATWPAAIPGA